MSEFEGRLKILVIDDDRDVRVFLSRFLTMKNFEVIEAADGEEGLFQLAQNSDVVLVILDWMMPGMSGIDVLQQITSQQEDAVPVLMLSAKSEAQDVVEAIDAGAVDYVVKPISKDYLLFKINNILERGREKAQAKAARRKSVHLTATAALMIARISGQAVTFSTSFPVPPGSVVILRSEEINLKADLPRDFRFSCRVTDCEGKSNKYRVRADIMSLSPEIATRLARITEESGWTS